MKNIEIKLKAGDFRNIRGALKRVRAVRQGVLRQNDTYFRVQSGRLKLRNINDVEFELIYYVRPDGNASKLSTYERCPLNIKEADAMKVMLGDSLGIKVVVAKRRELWLYKNTRIHLDAVKGLGNFIELETVIRRQTFLSAAVEHKEVIALLNLSAFPRIKWSYSDLLTKKSRT
jgi:predicted adenylyl cyclase CyaB